MLSPLLPGKGADVIEMRSQSLLSFWQQFGVPGLLALDGIAALSVVVVRKPSFASSAMFFFSVTVLTLAFLHVRFNYYLAIAVAVLSGVAMDTLLGWILAKTEWKLKWTIVASLGLLFFGPNIARALEDHGPLAPVTTGWKEALDWFRFHTPEPFADPNAYYIWHGPRPYAGWPYPYSPDAYSIMGWWDYGYWIEAIARRIPVANATQHNARLAAEFFLSQSEEEGLQILRQCRARYVVFDYWLPISGDRFVAGGQFWALFNYATDKKREDYLLDVWRPTAFGLRRQTFYRPAFYRSLLWRMFAAQGRNISRGVGAEMLTFREVRQSGTVRKVLLGLRPVQDQEDTANGLLVGEDPVTSCVPLEGLTRFRSEFTSHGGEVRIYSASEITKTPP